MDATMTHRGMKSLQRQTEMLALDHVGLVVDDLDAAVTWYVANFGLRVAWRETDTDVDPEAIGLPGQRVRLRGALLDTGSAYLELHEYLSPRGYGSRQAFQTGYGHVAFFAVDIHATVARLTEAGMHFNGPPRHITSGGLAGFWWVYGQDPWGNVIEICNHPRPPTHDRTDDQ